MITLLKRSLLVPIILVLGLGQIASAQATDYATAKVNQILDTQVINAETEFSQTSQFVELKVLSGPSRDELIDNVNYSYETGVADRAALKKGDKVIVNMSTYPETGQVFIEDFARSTPIWVLFGMFLTLVMLVAGKHGLKSFIGLVASILIIIFLYIPQVLAGYDPLLLSFAYGTVIMILALLVAHGVTKKTLAALFGTIITLVGVLIISYIFVNWANITGLVNEEARFLQIEGFDFSFTGLLIGAIVLGTLGVLDDVTVSQSSIVFELNSANPKFTFRELFLRALNVGRDHIASTVNTLALAYIATSLPLLLLLHQSGINLVVFAQSEIIATEIMRILIGSIGIVFSIPFTNYIACLLAKKDWLKNVPTGSKHIGCSH